MNGLVDAFLAGVVAVGLLAFARGRRGRPVDDHPVCRRCGFDLTGRPLAGGRCPECGGNLSAANAVRTGNRRRRGGLMAAGLAVVVIGALPLAVIVGTDVTHDDLARFEPLSWLLRDVDHGTPAAAWHATDEVCRRLRAGSLGRDDLARVAAVALRLQADRRRNWDSRWGDAVEAMNAAGTLSAADWHAYVAHVQTATLVVIPPAVGGDVVRFHVDGELRGGTTVANPRPVNSDCDVSIPGTVVPLPDWRASLGSRLLLDGSVRLTPAAWDGLRPGPQELVVRIVGGDGGVAANPALVPPLVLRAPWTLADPGGAAVGRFVDESLAAAVLKAVSVEVRVGPHARTDVVVRAYDLPADLACVVLLRVGDRECKSDGCVAIARGSPTGVGDVHFDGVTVRIGDRVRVVLRPSDAVNGRTLGAARLLDHEFVLDATVGL